ncbi:DUF6520 family protein [Sinomicrobium sp. M5D2P17]
MKTKRLILSLSAFVLAIVGVYAFSLQNSKHYRTVEADPNSCTTINVACDNIPIQQCRVASPVGVRFVWKNAGCVQVQQHSTSDILLPQ